MSRLFVTGDTHCNARGEFSKLNTKNFPQQKELTKDDFVLIAGDFGLLWCDSREERYWLDWLEDKPFTILFVDGNHENHAMLANFPESIIHLMRGQVFKDIAGLRVFSMGGASSHDIQDGVLDPDEPFFEEEYRKLRRRNAMFRVKGQTWWPEELPSPEEYAEAERNLDACGRKVDLVVTHCAPTSISDLLSGGMYKHDALTDYLETVKQKVEYNVWAFGHYHDDGIIEQKHVLLYNQVLEVLPGEIVKGPWVGLKI